MAEVNEPSYDELFVTGMAIEKGQCKDCGKSAYLFALHDKTRGMYKLCNDCIAFYHVHVNMGPCVKKVKEESDTEKALRERKARVENRDPMLPRRLAPQPPPWPQGAPTETQKARAVRKGVEDELINDLHGESNLLAAVVSLLILDKAREICFERTVQDGDHSVTERFEVMDEG